jgi:hypothetical protein
LILGSANQQSAKTINHKGHEGTQKKLTGIAETNANWDD